MVTFTRKMISAIKNSQSADEMNAVALHLSAESNDLAQGAQKWNQAQQFARGNIYSEQSQVYYCLSGYARMRSDFIGGLIEQTGWERAKKNADYALDLAYSADTNLSQSKDTSNPPSPPQTKEQILSGATGSESYRSNR